MPMAFFHPTLTPERWNHFASAKQILNIAAELARSRHHCGGEPAAKPFFLDSLDRAFELIDLTINDREKWTGNRRRELLRLREMLGEFYLGFNASVKELNALTRALLTLDKDTASVEL